MSSKKCELCGHHFPNQTELENHIETEHATGLDSFGVEP